MIPFPVDELLQILIPFNLHGLIFLSHVSIFVNVKVRIDIEIASVVFNIFVTCAKFYKSIVVGVQLRGNRLLLKVSRFISVLSDKNKKRCNLFCYNVLRLNFCGITWNRTRDTRIFSPLLYRLSYDTVFLRVQM